NAVFLLGLRHLQTPAYRTSPVHWIKVSSQLSAPILRYQPTLSPQMACDQSNSPHASQRIIESAVRSFRLVGHYAVLGFKGGTLNMCVLILPWHFHSRRFWESITR